ncbi:hypothetical protein DRN67_01990 [Candidatus Micrarchaeota archaeon]|nr:MAG: hypothetical protein DRN67_01990 [Candidatus Micrarchaeota archaeon]
MGEELLGIIPSKKNLKAIDRFKVEKEISEKFGEEALAVYVKADGRKNAEELRAELKMDEKKFLEVLGFLEEKGMIITKTVFEAELESKKSEGK